MTHGPFQPRFEALPEIIPVFPLAGTLLLPGGRLPLNIFEPRYLTMVLDALGQGRMIGMIQPTHADDGSDAPPLYKIGCLGRIASFNETEDGRLLISLAGICRFKVVKEEDGISGYRRVTADYSAFRHDFAEDSDIPVNRKRMIAALKPYFTAQEMDVNWKAIESAPDGILVTTLAMICPFEPPEKQALLEAPDLASRTEILTALVEMAVLTGSSGGLSQ